MDLRNKARLFQYNGALYRNEQGKEKWILHMSNTSLYSDRGELCETISHLDKKKKSADLTLEDVTEVRTITSCSHTFSICPGPSGDRRVPAAVCMKALSSC